MTYVELSANGNAAELWGDFQFAFARLRPSADATLCRVLDADPNFAVAHATAVALSALRPVDGIDPEVCAAAARAGAAEAEWERSFVDAALTSADGTASNTGSATTTASPPTHSASDCS